MLNEAELTQESRQNSMQIILKVPSAFLSRFDRTCEQLGYTRTEAIREAMRRFQQEGEQKLMQRPETAAENMRLMISEMLRPLIEMAAKEQEAHDLGKPTEVASLPQDRPTRRALTLRSKH